MTDMARELMRSFRRRAASVAVEVTAPRPAAVSIATPTLSEPTHAALCAEIQRLLETGRATLGLRRELAIDTGTRLDDDTVSVVVDGRPTVVIDAQAHCSDKPDWVNRTAARIEHVLHSRFALFLDENDRTEYADAIGRASDDDHRESYRRDLYQAIPDYLLGNGVSMERIKAVADFEQRLETAAEPTAAAVAEVVMEAIAEPTMTLELSWAAIRRVGHADLEEIPRAREKVYEETGVLFPDLSLRAVDSPDAPIRLKINDIWVDTGVAGTASWPEVASGVKSAVEEHGEWLIRSSDVATQRDYLAAAIESLIELSRATYSDAVVASCLRALVRSGQNVRNLQRVLWLLHDTLDGPADDSISFPGLAADIPVDPRDDPEKLAARVRARILDEAWRTGAPAPDGPYVALSPEDGKSLISRQAVARALTERRIVAAYRRAGDVGLALAPSVDVVGPLRFALGSLENPPPVVSMQELPVDADITTLRV